MKTKLLIITTMFACASSVMQAQGIPNHSFENWANGINSAPDGWEDRGSNHSGFFPAIQTNDHSLGSYAVRLENKITATDTTNGNINTIRPNGAEGFGPAFPVATRHNNLKGFYKYTPLNGDSAQVIVYITKTGFTNPQYPQFGILLAWGQKNLGAAATFTPFSVGYLDSLTNFFYWDNAVVPDSAYVDIAAYKSVGPTGPLKPLGNSILIVDALNFDTYLSGINEYLNITSNFKLFPTINNGAFDVTFETGKSNYTTIIVYDLNGKEIKSFFKGNLNSGQHTLHYDVSDLAGGTYLFVVATEEGYKAEKFTISK